MMNYTIAGAGDISDADDTTQFTYVTPFAGRLDLSESTFMWTEATGTQTGTQGVLSIEVGTTEYATLTAPQSAAIGTAQGYTVVPHGDTDAGNPVVYFNAGDNIVLKTKTQAVGGTIVGDGSANLAITFAV
tara:strand:- start:19 stop:411 length:393 start_codon:yes stop_codon:yes gene_type:complete